MNWKDFTQRLARELMHLPANAFLVVQAPGGFPYAQAMRYPTGLSAEVVSNEFLPPMLQMDEAGHHRLVEMEWQEPGMHGHVNWWQQVPLPPDADDLSPDDQMACGHLAQAMAAALHEVFHVPGPEHLEYRANRNGPEGGPLDLPYLGIPPIDPARTPAGDPADVPAGAAYPESPAQPREPSYGPAWPGDPAPAQSTHGGAGQDPYAGPAYGDTGPADRAYPEPAYGGAYDEPSYGGAADRSYTEPAYGGPDERSHTEPAYGTTGTDERGYTESPYGGAGTDDRPYAEPAYGGTASYAEPAYGGAGTDDRPYADPTYGGTDERSYAEPSYGGTDERPYAEPSYGSTDERPYAEPTYGGTDERPYAEPAYGGGYTEPAGGRPEYGGAGERGHEPGTGRHGYGPGERVYGGEPAYGRPGQDRRAAGPPPYADAGAAGADAGGRLRSQLYLAPTHEGGVLVTDRPLITDRAEIDRLISYLRRGTGVLHGGTTADEVDPTRGEAVPVVYLTDGVWVWTAAQRYYLERYGLPPHPAFYEHIVAHGYQVPDMPDELLIEAGEVALGSLEPRPLPQTADPAPWLRGGTPATGFPGDVTRSGGHALVSDHLAGSAPAPASTGGDGYGDPVPASWEAQSGALPETQGWQAADRQSPEEPHPAAGWEQENPTGGWSRSAAGWEADTGRQPDAPAAATGWEPDGGPVGPAAWEADGGRQAEEPRQEASPWDTAAVERWSEQTTGWETPATAGWDQGAGAGEEPGTAVSVWDPGDDSQGVLPAERPQPVPELTHGQAEFEERLAETRERGDHRAYFRLILDGELVLPSTGDPGDRQYATADFEDGTYVLSYTSPAAMRAALPGQPGYHRRVPFRDLALDWPKPEWRLSINAGLSSAAFVDPQAIERLAGPRQQSTAAAQAYPTAPEAPEAPATYDEPPAQAYGDGHGDRPAQAYGDAHGDRPGQAYDPSHGDRPALPYDPYEDQGGRPYGSPFGGQAYDAPYEEQGRPYGGSPFEEHGARSAPAEAPTAETPARRAPETPDDLRPALEEPSRGDGEPLPWYDPDAFRRGAAEIGTAASPQSTTGYELEPARSWDEGTGGAPPWEETPGTGHDLVREPRASHAVQPEPARELPRPADAQEQEWERIPVRSVGRYAAPLAPANRDAGVTVMQKAIPPEHVVHYLQHGYDQVAGHVHRLADVQGLGRPERLIATLGLAFEGSPFSPGDDSIHVLRWPAIRHTLFKPAEPKFAEERVPEFRIDSQRLPHGAELYLLDQGGGQTLVAVYDADRRRWRRSYA